MTVDAGTANADAGNQDAAAAAAAAANGDAGKAAAATPQDDAGKAAKGSAADAGKGSLAELVGDDADTRDWLVKQGDRVKDVPSVIKLAREQDKMIGEQAKKLGDAVRIPGKDATPEDIKAYRERMDIPLTAEGYEFKAPKELPADLPYDGERAKAFAAKASELGLPKKAAQELHDWFTASVIGDFNTGKVEADNQKVETAKAETGKLVKLWGPLDGETFKANAMFADKALMEVGGQEALDEFKRVGLIGEAGSAKIIQSAAIATMLAKFGRAVYAEGEILRGDAGKLNNPFADGDSFNMTAQMQMIKQNPEQAKSFIAAAGKKPSDFHLAV